MCTQAAEEDPGIEMSDVWPCAVPNRLAEPFTPKDVNIGQIDTDVSLRVSRIGPKQLHCALT